ncbi:hypothetical protein M426DRAFT_10768 [Hypoxylon sp. CI-4A]|nr:hypothetical protein M426DRAFT_10768 [Hypoxylon sp. CI-4A]
MARHRDDFIRRWVEATVAGLPGTTVLTAIKIERVQPSPIWLEGRFLNSVLVFPEWPQIPLKAKHTHDQRFNTLTLGDREVEIDINWRNGENGRLALTGDEILRMREAYHKLKDAVMAYLNILEIFGDHLEQGIVTHDPRGRMSRGRAYRRQKERQGSAPYFYDVLLLYILGFGTIPVELRRKLEATELLWLISDHPASLLSPNRGLGVVIDVDS